MRRSSVDEDLFSSSPSNSGDVLSPGDSGGVLTSESASFEMDVASDEELSLIHI